MKTSGQSHVVYFSDMPDETWLEGIDTRPTQTTVGSSSDNNSSSEPKDKVERPPKHQQATHEKQPASKEPMKKKKMNMPPPRKVGGITFKEPSVRWQVITDWSDDDENGGEMIQ